MALITSGCAVSQAYPAIETTLLAQEDMAFFINLCADLRNGKPVNFVPEIDGPARSEPGDVERRQYDRSCPPP